MEVKDIPLEDLELDEMNVRQHPYPQGELEDSIEKYGILDPLLVRLNDHEGYTIVCGSMRFSSAKAVGLKTLPCVIRELSDEEALVLSLTENIQRANLSLDEEADGVAKLHKIHKSEGKVAEVIGKSDSWVHDRLAAKGIIEVLKRVEPAGHVQQPRLPRDPRKVRQIAGTAKSLFPDEEDKQAELFDSLKNRDRREVHRASTYLRAKAEDEPEIFKETPIEEVVDRAFKVPQVDVRITFPARLSRGIIKCGEDREISWEDVVEIAVEQWLKDGGYLD